MSFYKHDMVSIIVPVYNVEKYLNECLDSIKKQTYRNIEVLMVVDGGSVDKSGEICEKYSKDDKRFRIINTGNLSLGMARNVGIDAAKGEWICFIDSDDCVHSKYVELLYLTAVNNGCITVKCAFSRIQEFSRHTDEEIVQTSCEILNLRQYFRYLFTHSGLGYDPFGVWCNIYHHSLFRSIRFGDYRFAEDSEFTPFILYESRNGKLAIIDSYLYYYRQRAGSLLNSSVSMNRIDRYHAKKNTMNLWFLNNETALFDLFFPDFFNCLVKDYIELSAEFPERKSEYEMIKKTILESVEQERYHVSPVSRLHPFSKINWQDIQKKKDEGIVLYGFGKNGKEILYWLKKFDIRVLEVWDQQFVYEEFIDGTRFCKAHAKLDDKALILLTIENYSIELEVKEMLYDLGYRNLMPFETTFFAIQYKKYMTYLPEIIDIYKRTI